MIRMEIDSPPEANFLSPKFRIVQRLALIGVPEENLEQLQPGLIRYVKENNSRVPEIVSAILPSDEDAMEAVLESQSDSAKPRGPPNLEDQFHESMIWLQWLMFNDEPGPALKHLATMSAGQRGICGAVWGNNDIAYRCRTCEHDPTCAICVPCFLNGSHKDHDYSIIYTGGGCCDCGDVTAWKREGFCSKHKGAEQIQPLPEEFAVLVGPVLDSLFVVWKKKLEFVETLSKETSGVAGLKKFADGMTSAVVDMLLDFCKYSESLLSFVSGRVLASVGLLDVLVRAERFLNQDIRKLQELLLKLLGEPQFKYEFAKVFLKYYPSVVNDAIKENNDSFLKRYPLLSTFSVQIFTVPTLTPRLVKEINLLTMLLDCLGSIFCFCAGEDGRLQVNKWGNLYETTIRVFEDIRFVMSHSVVPKYVTRDRRDILRTWMKLLGFVQGMNPQKRETGIHIEEENENMNLPFVLVHSIANIHSLLVAGAFSSTSSEEADYEAFSNKQDFEEQDSLRHAKVGRLSQESSVCGALDCASKVADVKPGTLPIPTSVSSLTFECLRAIENVLGVDNSSGLLSVLSPKTGNMSSNNFFALKRTLSKFRKGRYIFKAYNEASSAAKNTSTSENHGKQGSSSPSNSSVNSGVDLKGMGQDTWSSGFDDSAVEGDYANELEALRVLSLSDWPNITYDVSSQEISVHIPLHRLLSSVLQRALRRCYDESVSMNRISDSSIDPLTTISTDFFGNILGGCHPYGFSAFVMEHPLRVRVFCAEVHAGMWRKNGDSPVISCEWYHSVRWSEQGLELDLFLLQCCAALAPTDLYVNRILERFGLSNYLSLSLERSSEYEPFLMQEMLTLIIQIVKERRFCGLTNSECLQRELIYKLCSGDATHSQLVKNLPQDLSKLEQLQEILDTIAVYSNPTRMNQGMYRLRLSYWKELDLYHPRWNSRDLQVVEERYMRFCNVSALTTQLPKWRKVYRPFKGLARIATCKAVLQIIRSVLFYAVFTDKKAASRAPDNVLLAALHLLSLSLDVCSVHKESGDQSCYVGDSIPILAFAGEEIRIGNNNNNNRFDGQSFLSLLVSLKKKHKQENPCSFLETGSFDLSSLIENLLKKFAELDSRCMANLQILAPEVVNHLLQSVPNSHANMMGMASDADNRKAKARERQAAIMEKMRAQQSKFLATIKSTSDDGSDGSKFGQVDSSDTVHNSKESDQIVCSLCHDPNSKNPLSFLVLLQKSRLLGLVDRGPPSWEKGFQPEKNIFTCMNTSVPSRANTVPSNTSESIPSSQLMHLIQNAVNEFASDGQPREVNSFLDFIKARFPSVGNIQLPSASKDTRERFSASLETSEERMYLLIRGGMQDQPLDQDLAENFKKYSTGEDGSTRIGDAESLLLGKYIAALSKEALDNPSPSGSACIRIDKVRSKSTMPLAYDGFGPSDCDGIYLSSCGHAVHQGCLDRYLSSLKERYIRRIVFEGGHIVDPDQGEFLCPVCRGLVNSVLPALPTPKKSFTPPITSTNSPSTIDLLRVQQAFSLLRSAADVSGRNEILKTFLMQRNGRIQADLESVFRVLCGMYFPGKENISGSGRVSHSMIMWDTLKYSLMSTEIASRSKRDSLAPNYALSALYKELKSSSGFILSLLLQIVESTRTKNSLTLLLRLRGIQLFAESICSGVSLDEFPRRTSGRGGNMLCILENAEMEVRYPDIQFWSRASDPVLARDAFSSLMWILFCLPGPFLSCEESFLSLVHIFYVVSITQAIITYCGKCECNISELGFHDSLVTDVLKFMGGFEFAQQYFVSNYVDPSCDIKDMIHKLTFPYLRRCALLWNLINSSMSTPYSDGVNVLDQSSHALDDRMDYIGGDFEDLVEIEELEKMFKIPSLDNVLNDDGLRPLVSKWLNHFSKEFEVRFHRSVLHSTPVVPFKLMTLPHLYQDLLQRYIKQNCPDCGVVQEEPALCLLCGKLCSPNWKPNWKACCRKNGCQTHAMACGAGTGVFLLIRKTTILLQRSARQAPWPSPYLDAYGEEDIEMQRGKPLHLNEERYAALTHMLASHGLDRSSKVLRQTTIGAFFML